MPALPSRVGPRRHADPLDLYSRPLADVGDGRYDPPRFAQAPDPVVPVDLVCISAKERYQRARAPANPRLWGSARRHGHGSTRCDAPWCVRDATGWPVPLSWTKSLWVARTRKPPDGRVGRRPRRRSPRRRTGTPRGRRSPAQRNEAGLLRAPYCLSSRLLGNRRFGRACSLA